MKTKEVVDELTVKRAITRITYEIIERNKDLNKIVLAGIKTRGVFIAHRIQERLEQLENLSVPVVELDTKPFRDDIKVMTAYQVADLPEGFIKLDAMECPHHPFDGYESLLSEWADLANAGTDSFVSPYC